VRPATIAALAALLAILSACSPSAQNDAQHPAGEARRGPAERPDRPSTAAPAPPDELDYVALGDSLAAGVGADRGYVDRYAAHIAEDTGARVRTVNLGVSGQTSPELLAALRNDRKVHRALAGAEVVTLNIGLNDLGRAGQAYESGACGGEDGERCLRVAVDEVGKNWEAIVAEILTLVRRDEVIVRTPGLGYVPRAGADARTYLDEVNRRIAAIADQNGIPHTEIRLGQGGMSPDGIHPNAAGHATIAEKLRDLGYGYLG
jgi:lysophospholipase L1-like esterase